MEHRKRQILEATINDYIQTAEPVGSVALQKRHPFNLSSATIRHELNELEKQGYLEQKHTSSGRIPTDKGYRLYVDTLMNVKQLPRKQRESFEIQIQHIGSNVEDILDLILSIVSGLIDYTTIVITPDIFQEAIKVVHLVLIDIDTVLVVLLNSIGSTQEFLLSIQDKISQEELNRVSKLLTHKLEGKNINAINEPLFASLVSELPQFKPILKTLLKGVKNLRSVHKKNQAISIKGISKMLKLPEFQNIEYTQKVLSLLEENRTLTALLSEYIESDNHQVLIGKETNIKEMEDCSIVLTPCKKNDETAGVLGILGPKRMAYPTILSMVEHIHELIQKY